MKKKLTILDIARLTGVGKSTVSRVLNQDPRVKQATREKIEQVIAELHFVPSKSARAMRNQRQHVVGIIVSRLDSSSENQAVRGMLKILYQRGYDVVLMESQFSATKVCEQIAVLERRNVDGIILFAFNHLNYDSLIPLKQKLVLMARNHPSFTSVCYKDVEAMQTIFAQLSAKKIDNIAYIGVDTADLTTGQHRLDAYLHYCQEQGYQPNYGLGDLSLQSGYELAASLLTPFTQALVCASDTLAIGAAKYLQEQDRSEVLVTGLGNNPMFTFLFPNGLSVDLGYKEAGEQAAFQLLSQIE